MNDLYSNKGYYKRKNMALNHLHHAIEQGERDQWFNAINAIGKATVEGAAALQSIVNRPDWAENRPE